MHTTSSSRDPWFLPLLALLLWLPASGRAGGEFNQIQVLPVGDVALGLAGVAGDAWRIETSPDLTSWASWLTFRSTGSDVHVDAGAPYAERRFYPAVEVAAADVLTGDHVATARGDLVIHPVSHASLVLGWNGRAIYVDPVGGAARYQGLPRADLILITHQHSDHLEAATISGVRSPEGVMVAPQAVYNTLSTTLRAATAVLPNGAHTNLLEVAIEALPAYNLTSSFHAKGAGNGYLLTVGGKRIYISGDTEDIPEMRALRDVDVAFVCMNLPYTMSLAKAVSAVREFHPKVVYPYHYRSQDGTYTDREAFKRQVGRDLGIEVRLRDWY